MPSEHIQHCIDSLLDEAEEAVARQNWAAVSSPLRELVEPSGEFAFDSLEPVALKGLDGEHVLHAVGCD